MTKKILLILFFPLFLGCSKDLITSEYMMQGKWAITSYSDGTAANTALFSGYQFEFVKSNIVNITKDKTSFSETWITNTSADGSKNFEMVVQSPALKKIDGVWKVKSVSSGTLSLLIAMDSAIYNKKLIFETI